MSPETAKGLNFIKKAELVEEKRPRRPTWWLARLTSSMWSMPRFEEEDKNLPTEAGEDALPGHQGSLRHTAELAPQQVTLLLRHMKIDGDNTHCVYEKKMGPQIHHARRSKKPWSHTCARTPMRPCRPFGSKAAKTTYMVSKVKDIPVKGIFIPDEGDIHVAEAVEGLTKASS